MSQNQDDPAIDEIRRVRHLISERFDHDPTRLVAHYMEVQQEYRERLIGDVSVPVKKLTQAAIESDPSDTTLEKV